MDYEGSLWERKYNRLANVHSGLGSRLAAAERELAQLKNRYNSLVGKARGSKEEMISALYTDLDISSTKLKATTTERDKLKTEVRGLKETLGGVRARYQAELDAARVALKEELARAKSAGASTTRTQNRLGKVVGVVSEAYKEIERLNAQTPYRPGAVESILRVVMGKLKKVQQDVSFN